MNRDNESAILLSNPGICAARIVKLPSAQDQVRRLMSLLMKGMEERPLLMILMVALSQNTIICFLHHSFPQRIAATTIGYHSNKAVDEKAN